MKKIFFLVWTCIKPNLVLSGISEMKSEMNRWRKIFLVRTCIKPNLVLSEISEIMRWRVRWRKFFLGPNMYQAKSGVIWNQWDNEMKSEMKRWTDEEKFFWVRTCIKPNLVLSEISEIMRWRVRWRNFFFWSEHVSSQIWCYLKLVRWRDEEWDEQMKKIFLGLNMYQAKSGVIWN